MNKSINLERLYAFVLFADYGFDRAATARRLNITPNQLATQMRALEQEAGVPLFVRLEDTPGPRTGQGPSVGIDWRNVRLTVCGRRLLRQSAPFMRSIVEMEEVLRLHAQPLSA